MAASAANIDVQRLDPYAFMAVIGKRVIHRGGRGASDALLARAGIDAGHEILEVGCGMATTATRVAREHGARITAVDIDPVMLERAEHNVKSTGRAQQVRIEHGDIVERRAAQRGCLPHLPGRGGPRDAVRHRRELGQAVPSRRHGRSRNGQRAFRDDDRAGLRGRRGHAQHGGGQLRTLSRPAYLRKRAWLWPRIRRAVPYLGFVLISGAKPIEG